MSKIRLKDILNENTEPNEKIAEGKFSEKEYELLIANAFDKLYIGINTFENLIPNYMKRTGQGGMVSTYQKQYGKEIANVLKAVERLEKKIDR